MASEQIINMIEALAEITGRELGPKGAELMVRALEQFPEERALKALMRCSLELSKFPTVAEVIERMPGMAVSPEQEATLMANHIISRISLDGYTNLERAKERLGPKAWRVVELFGGWGTLCSVDTGSLQTVRAQLEKLARAVILRGDEAPQLGQSKALTFQGLLEKIEERNP